MTRSAVTLAPKPTLTDIQAYIDAKVNERGLKAGTQEYFLCLVEEVGELAKALRPLHGIKLAGDARDQNIAHEAADVAWLLICVCNSLGINLEEAIRSKEEKNEKRVWS